MNYMNEIKDVNELSVIITSLLKGYTANTFLDISDTLEVAKIEKVDYPSIIEYLKEFGITGLTFDDFDENTTCEKLSKIVMSRYIKCSDRTCGNCSVMSCEILNAIANTGTIRLVNFGCNQWKSA